MAFDPDLDVAAQSAVREMIRLIERRAGLAAVDAYSLCSIAADVHVTQLVNRHKGVHVRWQSRSCSRRLSATANDEGLKRAGVCFRSPAQPVSSSA